MDIAEFEELNVIEENFRSVPFELYFGDMQLEDDQKETRKEFAYQMEEIFYMVFMLALERKYPEMYLAGLLSDRYTETVRNFTEPDDYLLAYIPAISADIVHTTMNHLEEPYYTSFDRAEYDAENEANTVLNHEDYRNAVGSGKTQKTWQTMLDERVRPTHWLVEGVTVPIEQPFAVGNSFLMYPKDTSLGADASEIINCRCRVVYF